MADSQFSSSTVTISTLIPKNIYFEVLLARTICWVLPYSRLLLSFWFMCISVGFVSSADNWRWFLMHHDQFPRTYQQLTLFWLIVKLCWTQGAPFFKIDKYVKSCVCATVINNFRYIKSHSRLILVCYIR